MRPGKGGGGMGSTGFCQASPSHTSREHQVRVMATDGGCTISSMSLLISQAVSCEYLSFGHGNMWKRPQLAHSHATLTLTAPKRSPHVVYDGLTSLIYWPLTLSAL